MKEEKKLSLSYHYDEWESIARALAKAYTRIVEDGMKGDSMGMFLLSQILDMLYKNGRPE
jgi:hypothetical protein